MTSTNFLHKIQMKRVWNIWLERCENSEELRTYPSTRRARGYHKIKLLQKSVSRWRAYCRWRRHRKQQIHIAHTHYTSHALPRYFKRMQIFVQIMKVKQENKDAADQFRREVLFAKTFFKWHDNYQLTLDRQMMNRMAILHYDGGVKSCYFALWRQRTRQERRQHRLQAKADDHRTYCLLSTAFCEWRDFITGRKMSCYHFHAAVRHHRLCSLAKIWLAWTQYVQHKQVKWRKQATADLHYQQRVTGKLLGAWKLYSVRSRDATATASQRSTAHLKERLRISFFAWCRYTVRHRNSRLSNQRARTMYTRTMLHKVLLLWRQHAVLSAVTAEQTSVIVQQKRVILDQGKKRHALLSWISFTQSSLHDKSQLIKSYEHHRNKLLQHSLSKWQTFVRSRFRIKIHKRQSMWYHNRRIICTYFKAWKQQYTTSLEVHRKTSLSLWHWSVVLQRKAFFVLLQYAISKKNKEIRIAQALDQRRSRLLENSVSQWIKVAFDLSTERNRNAQARYIRQVDSVHQYVYKCAVHWRRWTARRKTIKAQQLHHSPSIEIESPDTIYTPVAEPTTRNYPQVKSGGVTGDFFKARPKPRVPDYLRESFDVTDIDMRDDKAPISPSVISMQTSEKKNKVLAEELPRAKPPSPYLKPANHPAQRAHEIDLFLPSSEGESETVIIRKDGFRKKVFPQSVAQQKARIHTGARIGTPLLLPPSSFETQPNTKRHGNNGRHDKEPCGKQGLLLQTSFLPADSSGSSFDGSYDDKQHNTIPHEIPFALTSGGDLQAQIFDARNRLQDHYQMKIYYRSVKRRRDQLEVDLCNQQGDTSDDDTTTRDHLAKLNKETKDLLAKIVRDRPLVEALATKVKQLIEKIQI